MELTKPLGYYTDNTALRFHMLDVGEGLMILIIFPNDQVMLFDCNVTDDNESTILDYLSANIPFKINPDTGNAEQFIEQSFRKSVEQYIQFYNEVRPHQTLKYQTPQAFEDKHYAKFIENPCSNSVIK